jgi:hypothetical protein
MLIGGGEGGEAESRGGPMWRRVQAREGWGWMGMGSETVGDGKVV